MAEYNIGSVKMAECNIGSVKMAECGKSELKWKKLSVVSTDQMVTQEWYCDVSMSRG